MVRVCVDGKNTNHSREGCMTFGAGFGFILFLFIIYYYSFDQLSSGVCRVFVFLDAKDVVFVHVLRM